MPFAAFMSLALYHPKYGYYTAGPARVGWAGHYVTAPELDPAFGALWARGLEEVWESCGRPHNFHVIEIGPGRGTFMSGVTHAASAPFLDALSITLIERSPRLKAEQERLFRGLRVGWSPSVTELGRAETGCVFANEVLDNLPVHLVERSNGAIVELLVGVDEHGRFSFVAAEPSNPELWRCLTRAGIQLDEGHRYEIPLAAEALVGRVAGMFERGAAIFIDYGHDSGTLAALRDGTLAAYSARGVTDRVLDDVGEQDITAHVNWTLVEHACRAHGLHPAPLRKQRDVLATLGAAALDEDLRRCHDEAIAQGRGSAAIASLSRRQALGAVMDPNGLGGLDVLVATKGVPGPGFVAGER